MQVRVLTQADAESYRALRLASIKESPALSCPEIVHELAFFARVGHGLLAHHASGGTVVWGAQANGQLAGVVAASHVREGSSQMLHLWGLYVDRRCRRHGMGRSLMQAALGWARRQSAATKTRLYSNREHEQALRLFQRLGFEFVAEEGLLRTRLCAMQLADRAPRWGAAARSLQRVGAGASCAADGNAGSG